jgi:hypothetical protein
MASMTGWFQRVIVDSAGAVIDLSRKRQFTGSARVAVIQPWWSDDAHQRRPRLRPPQPHQDLRLHGPPRRRRQLDVHRPDGTELTQPAAA